MSKTKTRARRDKARQKKEADKQLIQLARERNDLWRMLCEAPLEKLKHPYQRGWIRFYAIKDEVLRRKDADRFRELLKYVQCTHYSRKRHFLVRVHAKSSRFRQRKHKLQIFTVCEALQIKIPEYLLSYFTTQNHRPIGNKARLKELLLSDYRGPIKIRHPHYFVRVIEPYMITHCRIALPEVERRLSEVEFILDQEHNRGRLKNLQCSHSYIWEQIYEEQQTRKQLKVIDKDIALAALEYHLGTCFITQEGVEEPPSLLLIFTFVWETTHSADTTGKRYLIAPGSSNG